MSVRDGLLAILSLGPAYGLQLHSELAARSPHRGPVNVGQVYATLDRLVSRGLVASAGVTDDGLPLYTLSESGMRAQLGWRSRAAIDGVADWTEMLDQVIVVSTVDAAAARSLALQYRRWWQADAMAAGDELRLPDGTTDARLALLARAAQASAAIGWLDEVLRSTLDSERALSSVRPRRGRRPAPA
jgi:DNA-binding PadR family transcriptional regulator